MRFAAIVVGVGLLAAWTSDPPEVPVTSSDTPSSSLPIRATPTPATDSANAVAAKRAYLLFISANYAAERRPSTEAAEVVSRYSIDTARKQALEDVLSLQYDGLKYAGTPPVSRLRIVDERLRDRTPVVLLVDCPTVAKSWRPVAAKSGKPSSILPEKVQPPFAVAITVARVKKMWLVAETKTDRTRTCKP